MLQLCFPVINKMQTIFTPFSIANKHTRELRVYEIPMRKKLISLRFRYFLYVSTNKLRKVGENNPSCVCPCRIEKSQPQGWNITKQASSLVQIPTPRVRYLFPTWALIVDCNNLTWVKTMEIPSWCARISKNDHLNVKQAINCTLVAILIV